MGLGAIGCNLRQMFHRPDPLPTCRNIGDVTRAEWSALR